MDYIILILIPFWYCSLMMCCVVFEITPEHIVNFISKKLVKTSLLTKIDFEKTKNYYRDILYNHSIIELSYIDDFEIDLKKEVVSTLLNLELKKKIKITDSKIEVINDDDTDLKLTEKDVFHCIENGKVKIKNKKMYLDLLQEHALQEGIESGLLSKIDNDTKSSKLFKVFIIFALIVLITPIFLKRCFYGFTYEFDNNKISVIGAYLYVMIFCFIVPIYTVFTALVIDIFIRYRKMMINVYERTGLGNSLNEKIEGLKKYIKDYSLLDEKEREALVLWDEYLIYSVQFNQNKEVIKKISNLIEIKKLSKILTFTKKELVLATIIFILLAIIVNFWEILSPIILPILAFAFVIFAINH